MVLDAPVLVLNRSFAALALTDARRGFRLFYKGHVRAVLPDFTTYGWAAPTRDHTCGGIMFLWGSDGFVMSNHYHPLLQFPIIRIQHCVAADPGCKFQLYRFDYDNLSIIAPIGT